MKNPLKKLILFNLVFCGYLFLLFNFLSNNNNLSKNTSINILAVFATISPTSTYSPTPSYNNTPTTTITPTTTFTPTPSPSVSPKYEIIAYTDKSNVTPQEKFQIKIQLENKGSQINNFEIRVPFIKTLENTNFISEKPSFNKLLDSNEFPNGFNNRSWIVNYFLPNEKKEFYIEYETKLSEEENPTIASSFSLPVTWIDPAGLSSNKQIKLDYLRLDIYINKSYVNSIPITLPKYESLTVPISKVKLPTKYIFNGSETTDLSKINKTNYNSVQNFTLDTEFVKINFLNTVDLSDKNVPNVLSNLDNYLELSWGKLVLKKEIPFLRDIPVRITFKNTNFINPPLVKLDHKDTFKPNDLNGNYIGENTYIEIKNLVTSYLLPDIITEKNLYETESNNIEIPLKVSDPKASIVYSLENQQIPVDLIDISTGGFTIKINNIKEGKTLKLDIYAKLPNNETNNITLIIKNTLPPANKDEPSSNTLKKQENNFLDFNNPLLNIILIIILVTIIIILLLFYLVRLNNIRKKRFLEESFINNINLKILNEEKDDPNLFPVDYIKVKIDDITKNKKIDLFSIKKQKNNNK